MYQITFLVILSAGYFVMAVAESEVGASQFTYFFILFTIPYTTALCTERVNENK